MAPLDVVAVPFVIFHRRIHVDLGPVVTAGVVSPTIESLGCSSLPEYAARANCTRANITHANSTFYPKQTMPNHQNAPSCINA